MMHQSQETTIHLLGKAYQLRCDDAHKQVIQKATEFLEQRLLQVRKNMNQLNMEKAAIVTALQMAVELLNLEHDNHLKEKNITDRIQQLHQTLDQLIE